jgi:hypothetical protein
MCFTRTRLCGMHGFRCESLMGGFMVPNVSSKISITVKMCPESASRFTVYNHFNFRICNQTNVMPSSIFVFLPMHANSQPKEMEELDMSRSINMEHTFTLFLCPTWNNPVMINRKFEKLPPTFLYTSCSKFSQILILYNLIKNIRKISTIVISNAYIVKIYFMRTLIY